MDLLERYKILGRPLILDGAMGSLLQMQGLIDDDPVWSANALTNYPDSVYNIHQNYIFAGADIVTSNTFRTNPNIIKKSGSELSSKELVKIAVRLAKDAASDSKVIIAGSNPPAEDCYQAERKLSNSELINNHFTHIDYLLESEVDIIWNETFSHLDEIKIVCEYCSKKNIPYVVNLFLNAELKILSGEPVKEVLKILKYYNPLAIGINCISPKVFENLLANAEFSLPFGFYLNCGGDNYLDNELITCVSPNEYAELADRYIDYSPLYIGSCCGSTPDHTRKLKEKLSGQN